MRILVINAGSSSLKISVLDDDDRVASSTDLSAPRGQADMGAVAQRIENFGKVDAVGHRIVHGGMEFVDPILIDAEIVMRLRSLVDLALLHQPKSLAALEAVSGILPKVLVVACFETTFHAGMPATASTYALPSAWRKRWSLRRYGFHGLSHAYASRHTAEILGRAPQRCPS
jgi:acetate kinase